MSRQYLNIQIAFCQYSTTKINIDKHNILKIEIRKISKKIVGNFVEL